LEEASTELIYLVDPKEPKHGDNQLTMDKLWFCFLIQLHQPL